MSKKSKRIRAKQTASVKQSDISQEKQVKTVSREAVAVTSSGAKTLIGIQESQYRYIMPEVLRICIITGVIFVVIIVLSFIIK